MASRYAFLIPSQKNNVLTNAVSSIRFYTLCNKLDLFDIFALFCGGVLGGMN